MAKTTLILVRHGETEWNTEKRWQGHSDSDLTALGRAQAKHVAERLALEGVEALYSSDSGRAMSTARIIGQKLNLSAQPLQGLREFSVGTWEGLVIGEIQARYPQEYRAWLEDRTRPRGGGESAAQLADRAWRTIKAIFAENEGRTVVAVSHGGTIQIVAAHVLGRALSLTRNLRGMENCALTWLVQDDDGEIHLQRYNVPALGIAPMSTVPDEPGEAL